MATGVEKRKNERKRKCKKDGRRKKNTEKGDGLLRGF